jgi:hypothetical protein
MDYQAITIGLGIAGFSIQGLVLAAGGVWKLAQMEARIKETITTHRTELDDIIARLREQTAEGTDRARRDIGETILAMQTKIAQFEIWTRDTFVRRESFLVVITRIEEGQQRNADKLDERLGRIEGKIEALQARQ